MEFVRVRYPREAGVLVGGFPLGPTNHTLKIDRGTHTFTLSEPTIPPAIEAFVGNTTPVTPKLLEFTPAVAVQVALARAVPPAPTTRAITAPKPARKKAPQKTTRKKATPKPAAAKSKSAKAKAVKKGAKRKPR